MLGHWGLLVLRRFMPHLIVSALLIMLDAGAASAREAVSLPVSCDSRAGRVIVRSSLPRDHEILTERERQVFSACRPGRPNECRPILVYRFDVACGTERVQWLDLAAALLSAYGRNVWIEQGRLHIRPRAAQPLGTCDNGDPAFSFMSDCEPWMQSQNAAPAWVLPAGFAPVHEVGARLVELPPAAAPAPAPTAAARAEPHPEPPPGDVGSSEELEPQAPDPSPARSAETLATEPTPVPGAQTSRTAETARLEPAEAAGEPSPPAAAEPEPASGPLIEPALRDDRPPKSQDRADRQETSPDRGEVHTISVSDWSPSVAFTEVEETGPQLRLRFLTALDHISAELRHLRFDEQFTAVLMGIALLSGLLSGIGWYSGRVRRTKAAAFRMAEPQRMSFRPSTALLVPSDEKMCGELCRTAHSMLQQIDARVDELQGVAPLRRVLQREMRNLEQFLTAVMTASPAEPEEWRRMRNRLQRIVKELHRLRDIVEGAYRSLSGGGFTGREPPRDKYEAYEALGVNPDVSMRTLKKLVDALRACWHPDLAKDETDRLAREERMKRINIAWDIITAKRQEA